MKQPTHLVMPRFSVSSLLRAAALLALLSGSAPSASAGIDSEVKAVLKDRLMRNASVGVEVVRLGTAAADAKEVYARDAATPKVPASNLKLATTSAALDYFGPDFKFRTVLLKHGDDLVLVGDGDPTFGDAEYLRRVGWQTTTVFEGWAAQLKKMNVGTVRDVVVDDSVFDTDFFHPNWPGGQLTKDYMAQVSGLNFDANLVDLVVQSTTPGARVNVSLDPPTDYVTVPLNRCVTGTSNAVSVDRQEGSNALTLRGQAPSRGGARVSVTVHDPPLYAGSVLAETLSAAGVKVGGRVRRDRTARQERIKAGDAGAAQWAVVGIHETPIDAALGRANKDSVNLYAESLCKRLGHASATTASTWASGSWANGTAAVAGFLKRVGVPEAEFHLDDGCGLSKQNVISPHALVTVLTYDFCGKNHDVFLNSLSVAGVDGTLERRFEAPHMRDLRRRVLGKSGFVEGVSTLTGLLHARDGNWYAFSIMMNGIPRGSNQEIKPLQERIVRAIDADAAVAAGR